MLYKKAVKEKSSINDTMASYSDIEDIKIRNPKVVVGVLLGGCIFFIWKFIVHVII